MRVKPQSCGVWIEEHRHCREILQQLAALNAAAQRLGILLLEDHVAARVEEGASGAALADETGTLIGRILKIYLLLHFEIR